MARAVFDMIDKDQSGTLTKKEIVDAVRVRVRREGAFDSPALRFCGNSLVDKTLLANDKEVITFSMTAATRTSTCSCRLV